MYAPAIPAQDMQGVTWGDGGRKEVAVAQMGLRDRLGGGCGHRWAVWGGEVEGWGAVGNRGAVVAVVVNS